MIEKFKVIINSNKNIIISFIACLTVVSILLFMSSSLKITNISTVNYDPFFDKLVEANDNLSIAIDNLSIDADLACTKLNESSELIEDLSTLLLTVDSSYYEDEVFNYLVDLVDETSDLYFLTSQLIENPNDINDNTKIETLSLKLDSCKGLYQTLQGLGVDISIGCNTEIFFDNTINYANTVILLNRDLDIKEDANRDFMLVLDSFSKSLNTLNQDLMPAIIKMREDKRSFSPLIDDLNEKKNSLQEIRDKLNLLSIPEDCVHFYNSLNDILVICDKYLATLESSILFEIDCNNYSSNKEDIDKKYNNAMSKFNDMQNSYATYKKLFDN